MRVSCFATFLLLMPLFDCGCFGENEERTLVRRLLDDYDTSVRPSKNASTTLNVTFGLSLTQIIDVDERNQILTTNCWLNQMWIDYSLQWNASLFSGIKVVRIPAEKVWKPDIILYNNADSQYNLAILSTNVIVSSEGNLTWLSTAIFKSLCQINVEYFPFDEQTCEMKFASWTYDGFQVNLVIQTEDGDLSNYVPNGEWDLIKMTQKRHVVYYSCCSEPYPDVTYSITLRRRPLFYVFNLILPCVLISGLALLSFYMPSDSGEKVTLGITTLLSMTVFLMVIGESMPPTSEKLPLIGLYYGVTISLVSFATGLSVVTLNIHHRGMRGRELPSLLRTFLFSFLARVLFLRLDFPKREPDDDDELNAAAGAPNQMADGSSSATGLLSRKLPMSDTWRVVYPNMPSTPPHQCSCDHNQTLNNSWHSRSKSTPNYSDRCGECYEGSKHRFRPVMKVRGIPVSEGGNKQHSHHQRLVTRDDSFVDRKPSFSHYFDATTSSNSNSTPPQWERRLSHLLNRVVITMERNENRMTDQDKKDAIKLEWQQAALIIDRLLLWIFVVATVGATFGILYMSPHTRLFTS